jgi:hypothetical protein
MKDEEINEESIFSMKGLQNCATSSEEMEYIIPERT